MSDPNLGPDTGSPAIPTCQMVSDALSDYLEGHLADRARISLEEHLEMCPLCLVYLDHFRTIYHISGAPEAAQLPGDFNDVMGKVIRAWRIEQQAEQSPVEETDDGDSNQDA
jgi:anti-sigma factor RsiW